MLSRIGYHMKPLFLAFCVAVVAQPTDTAIAQTPDNQAVERWQTQVQDQPIRATASVQHEFSTDQITVSLEFSSVHQTFDGLIATLRRRKTDINRESEQAGMRVAETTITRMELRQRRSDSDDYKYFGDVTVQLTITGIADPLEVAARLKKLSARSIGDLQYSMSGPALATAEQTLRDQALDKIRREAASEAQLRGTQLGNMIRFEFESHANRRKLNAQNVVVISGRGLAVFKPLAGN